MAVSGTEGLGPNPMTDTRAGESAALVFKEISPVWSPVAVGRKTTVNTQDCWVAIAAFTHVPPSIWKGPVLSIACTVAGNDPVLVTVIVNGAEVPPTGTLPKSCAVWLSTTTATGGGPAARPTPDKLTVCGDPGALLSMMMLPVAAPGRSGAKRTVSEHVTVGAMTAPSHEVSAVKGPCVRTVPRRKVPRPVLVTLIVWVRLEAPTSTSPKSWLVGETVTAGLVPVPLRARVGAGPLALLGMVTVPAFEPVLVGRKVAVNVQELPAAIDVESQVLLTANCPVTDTVPTTSAMVPVFVIVNDCAGLVVPNGCSPKSWLALLMTMAGNPPVPLSATVDGEPEASLGIVMVPVLAPVLVGLNVAVSEQVLLGAIFTPLQVPLIPNWPVTLRFCRLKSEVPVFVIVRVNALLVVPTRWRPKE